MVTDPSCPHSCGGELIKNRSPAKRLGPTGPHETGGFMNRRIILGAAAGVAAIALAVGGTTFSAWSDYGDVNGNSVGAGFLKLDLNGQTGDSPVAPINWGKLAPGMVNVRTVWLASNDGQSVPDANISATFNNLVDHENGCSTNSEAAADPSCGGSDQNSGELSHILNFQTSYYAGLTENECATYPTNPPGPSNGYNAFFASNQGDLYNAASGAGHTYTLDALDTSTPLVLHPGDGICIGFQAYWPHDPSNQVSAPYNDDNVAQGDSFSFDIRFTLSQV
jgi:predicted ribosomally synthesized peptide with SipW-like signal peptide